MNCGALEASPIVLDLGSGGIAGADGVVTLAVRELATAVPQMLEVRVGVFDSTLDVNPGFW